MLPSNSVNLPEPVLCLASGSKQRLALLNQIGVTSVTMPMDIDESQLEGESIEAYVGRVGLAKARAGFLALESDDIPVLGADTALYCKGQILTKPTGPEKAAEMLQFISGSTHQVCTGAGIVTKAGERMVVVTTNVTMAELSDDNIRSYVASGEPIGKAGSYGIQGIGATLIKSIEGSYSNVVGLPLYEVAGLLNFAGIKVVAPINN